MIKLKSELICILHQEFPIDYLINSNNSNLTSDKNSKMTCNVSSNIHGAIKKNNINNQKGNISRNSKNISKINIIGNNNDNLIISSKKKMDFKSNFLAKKLVVFTT